MSEIIGFRVPVTREVEGVIYIWTNDENMQEDLQC